MVSNTLVNDEISNIELQSNIYFEILISHCIKLSTISSGPIWKLLKAKFLKNTIHQNLKLRKFWITSCEMYHSTASKVMEAIDAKPTFGVPYPMGNDGIYKSSNHNTINNISSKTTSFCKWSGHKRCSCCSKYKLEEPFGEFVRWNTEI